MDRLDELLGRRVLQEEPARAGAERLVDVLVEVERREDENARPLVAAVEQAARRLEAVHVRHADVHEDDVRVELARGLDGLGPVGGLTDDLHVVLGLEDHPEPRAHEGLVVDDEHADHQAAASIGSRARTT